MSRVDGIFAGRLGRAAHPARVSLIAFAKSRRHAERVSRRFSRKFNPRNSRAGFSGRSRINIARKRLCQKTDLRGRRKCAEKCIPKDKLNINSNYLVIAWREDQTGEWRKQQILTKPSWQGAVYREVRMATADSGRICRILAALQ